LLRRVRYERRADQADFGALASGCQECIQIVGKELDVFTGPVFEHELKPAGSADSRNGRWREGENGPLRKLAEQPVHARLDFLILLRPGFAVTPGLQSNEKEGVVTGLDKAEQAEANNTGCVFDTWRIGEDLLNLFRRSTCALERSRIRKLHVDIEIALVLIRQEAGW